jgi:hypothetical protein
MAQPKTYSFQATLENSNDGMDTSFVRIPLNVEETFGTKGQVKVNASFDGVPYRGILANMGQGCHVIGVRKDIRKAIAKGPGDRVKVTIQQDLGERTVDMPPQLVKLLKSNANARKFYDTLSYTNRKEYAVWISSAKKSETLEKRVSQTLVKLLARKKNPSEK